MNYTEYVQQIATMAVVPVDDPNFQIIIPQMINYAELRMQRELDFLSTMTENTSYTLTANTNTLNIQTSSFVTLQTLQISDFNGVEYPVLPVTKEYLQNVWNIDYPTGIPQVFAVYGGDALTGGKTSQRIILGLGLIKITLSSLWGQSAQIHCQRPTLLHTSAPICLI